MTELPTTFGKYYLTDKLATGGMAEIFLGKLIGPGGFEKQLVIKQIHPALSGQRHFVDLFVAEAKTLVALTHGNIVPVYELGVVDDTYFIAMEYIDGPTLYQLTEARFAGGGALAPALAGWLVAEIARGLDYAHRKGAGVVHRDLSPRNVMLSRDGEVKIVDFGIAVDPGAGDEPAGDDRMPTGSFAYMSPEQVARRPLTGQSDLFSLGVLAWEMLVGERLFARATPEETLAAVREAPIPRPSSRRPEVPARLDEVVLRALERDPARRWGSAAELLSPLQRYLFGLTNAPGPREVAALVAASCPPAGRRAQSEPVDAPIAAARADADAGPSTRPVERPAGDAGPSTRPVERRRRPPTIRQATFATHVDLARALGQPPPPDPSLAPSSTSEPAAGGSGGAPPAAEAPPTPAPTARPDGRGARPRRRRAIGLAVAAAVMATLAIAILRPCVGGDRGRLATTTGDAAPGPGPGPGSGSGTASAAGTGPAGAGTGAGTDAGTGSGSATAPAIAVDAGVAVRPRDAGARRPADARPAATGTLKVGADPWGEVYVDGRRLGRAPGVWPVAAGRHVVEVVFPSEQGELRRRFPVDVAASAEARVFADFRAAGSGAP